MGGCRGRTWLACKNRIKVTEWVDAEGELGLHVRIE